MNRRIQATAALLLTAAATFAVSPSFFAPHSRLADGHWVKVGVKQTGLYEISYAKLREMGFEQPEKVGVLGRGGRQMDIDFTDKNGNRLNPDDLSPVAVAHIGGKLIFYGQGTETYEFVRNSNIETQCTYKRVSKNIYTDFGYYFLTDREGCQKEMQVSPSGDRRPTTELTQGVDYISHEQDLVQNSTNTGQLFWGERFNNGNPGRQEWGFDLPKAIPGSQAMMECSFYVERGTTGQISWGVDGSDQYADYPVVQYNSTTFRSQEPTMHATTIPRRNGKIFLEYTSSDNPSGIANLDYWALTYMRGLPDLRDAFGNPTGQEAITFPELRTGKTGALSLGLTPGATVFDVSDPLTPVIAGSSTDDNGEWVKLSYNDNPVRVIVADVSRPQLQIRGYETGWDRVANQDLHGMAEEGASLLIITIDELLPQAERLAELHRTRDGIRVAVATANQVYNEFSAGVPDPMAYRTFAKMLYESKGEKLRNVLLLGPLYSDFRGVGVHHDQNHGLIAFQNTQANSEKGAQNCNDFIGMMDDCLNGAKLEKCSVHVGVGILPCYFPSEAETYIDKLERYLDDDRFAYRLNRMTNIGGLGDRHTHDTQAVTIGKYINTNNGGRIMTTNLAIDAYGSKEARKKLLASIDEGRNLMTYFGHGGPTMLGKNKDFFTMADVSRIHNRDLAFMLFAGCVLSNSDRGERGLAEAMVLSNSNALVGGILATRDTWSGENMDMVKIIYNRMFKDGPSVTSPILEKPLTIGEVFARAKDQSEYSNELAYQLVCDPALVIPVPTRDIRITTGDNTLTPGRQVTLSGTVTRFDGTPDKDFNGEIVIRVARPETVIESDDLDTGDRENGMILKVPYADIQVAAGAGRVSGGEFDVTLYVPETLESHKGEKAIIYMSAYDHSRRMGAAARTEPEIKEPVSSSITRPDNREPSIDDFRYDSEKQCLVLQISDETALDTSSESAAGSLRLYIDGKPRVGGGDTPVAYGYDGSSQRHEIATGYLAPGTVHTARAEVSDLAGNRTVREISFETALTAGLALVMESEAATEKAEFRIEGATGKAEITVTDIEGRIVATLPADGTKAVWNLIGNDGLRVPSGVYKAYVRESRDSSAGRHSESIYVPVVATQGQ